MRKPDKLQYVYTFCSSDSLGCCTDLDFYSTMLYKLVHLYLGLLLYLNDVLRCKSGWSTNFGFHTYLLFQMWKA